MVEHTREHRRIQEQPLTGRRWPLSSGELLIGPSANLRKAVPLVIHFHGEVRLAQQSVMGRSRHAAVIALQLGSGSGVYGRAFEAPGRFAALLDEAGKACQCRLEPIFLTSFSAGYGAIRAILRQPQGRDRVAGIILADSLHASYEKDDQPGPLLAEDIAALSDFAKAAASGRKQMLVTHSEVFPGTYASTTETADFLLDALGLHRKAVLRWGPLGMQQLSEARRGRFALLGFAGNSAPDHIDHFQALQWWLRRLKL